MTVVALKTRYLSKPSVSRGRPKSVKIFGPTQEMLRKRANCGLQDNKVSSDMVSTLYSLKKISDQEYEAAKFYEELSYMALGFMGCATSRRSSLLLNLSNISSNQKVISKSNQKVIKKWLRVRSILMNYSKQVDNTLYEALVQNRMEQSMRNLSLFKEGLNVLFEYCSKQRMKTSI